MFYKRGVSKDTGITRQTSCAPGDVKWVSMECVTGGLVCFIKIVLKKFDLAMADVHYEGKRTCRLTQK